MTRAKSTCRDYTAWTPSPQNGGRHEIGTGGRLNFSMPGRHHRNPQLAALPGWSLLVTCECRRHPVHLPLAPIVADRGGRTMLKTVLDRLRCQHCGERPTRVDGVRGEPF